MVDLAFRKPLGFFAATAEELRQLRRPLAASIAGGITTAIFIPIILPYIQERLGKRIRTQIASGGALIRILYYRPTLILEEPLIKRLAKR